jgi:uncharacterized integral membrane protein
MNSPYKRRRPSLLRNFWVYRRLVLLAMVLGLILWFTWANNSPVTVAFPFGLGSFSSTSGRVILLSALVGSLTTAMAMTIFGVWKLRHVVGRPPVETEHRTDLPEELPPADYASKTAEGFRGSRWT